MKIKNLLNQQRILSLEDLFIIVGFAIAFISWFAFVLTEFQIFYRELLIIPLTAIVILLILILRKFKLRRVSKIDIFVAVFIFSLAVFNSFYAHDTFTGGRDYGVYANSAVYIAKQHTYVIENKYQVTMPGYISFGVNKVIPQFYLGYPSWLALHYSLASIQGIKWANFLPTIIGLFSLYLIGKKLLSKKAGLITVLLFATTYPMFWFTRRSFSEILTFSLTWFAFFCLLEGYYKKSNKYFIPTILSFSVLLVTRPEPLFIYLTFLAILSFLFFIRKEGWVFSKEIIVLIILSLLPFLYYSFFINTNYLYVITSQVSQIVKLGLIAKEGVTVTTPPTAIRYHMPEFVFFVFSKYGFLVAFFSIPLYFLLCLTSLKRMTSKFYFLLIFLIAPTFLYLVKPGVFYDQPWFLRRYLFSILPLAYLSLSLVITKLLKNKMLLVLAVSCILIFNLNLSRPILALREFDGMLENTGKIAKLIPEKKNSLILVDMQASEHYKMADPLFSVYDLNTAWVDWWLIKKILGEVDKATFVFGSQFSIPKIDKDTTLFLISEKKDTVSLKAKNLFPEENLHFIGSLNTTHKELIKTCTLYHLAPGNQIGNLELAKVKEFCGKTVPSEIVEVNHTIEINKIDQAFTESFLAK